MESAATTHSPVKGTTRLPLWDNARFLAVTLVVVGHSIQPLTRDSDAAFTLYLLIYAFHMPAFALISGYFSKAELPTRRSIVSTISHLIVPYFIMELAWAIVKFLIGGDPGFDVTSPSWTLWFLLSLATFRVILPYLAVMRWPLMISLGVSVGVGYISSVDSTFALLRTLGFLPFFVLGWKLSQGTLVGWWLSLERIVWLVRAGSLALFATGIAFIASHVTALRQVNAPHWLFYSHSYADMGAPALLAGGGRLVTIAAAVILSAAFLTLVPRRSTIYTALGAATMYVYLLHSFVLYPIRESGVLGGNHSSPLLLFFLCVFSVGLSFFLASADVRRRFRFLIEPQTQWLFRATDVAPPRSLPRVSSSVDLR